MKPGGRVKALEGLRHVAWPADRMEVLVAEGRQPSRQRNRAAADASGDILYFIDDDSMVSPGCLDLIARHFTDPGVAAVGGPSLTPSTDTIFQRAVGRALSSLLGGGGVRNRYRRTGACRETGEQELILCNLAIRREIFLAFGGLDERLYPNEENELLTRLKAAGHKLLHDPELAVLRSQRPGFRAFIRQMFTYGRGRAEQTLISGKVGLVNLVPALFLLYIPLALLAGKPVYYLPLLCYAMAVAIAALSALMRELNGKAASMLLFIFPSLHLSYGAGLLWGFLRPRYRKRKAGEAEVVVREAEL